MKNLCVSRILLISLSVILLSCGAGKQYQITSNLGTIQAYENFLKEYPKSSYAQPAAIRLKALYENRDWNIVKRSNSSFSYKKHLDSYPNGKNVSEAKSLYAKAVKDEKHLEDWNKAKSLNTIRAYEQYLSQNPSSKYSDSARSGITEIITSDWNKAKSKNSIDAYNSFIVTYPNSSFVTEARKKTTDIIDNNAWSNASSENTTASYSQYLRGFPSGNNSSIAKNRINQIQEEKLILPAWNRTQSQNTYQAYKSFLREYPNSSYAYQAKSKIQQFENTAWSKAQSLNTIASYNTFLSNFPFSDLADSARKKVIDLEVANIFKGDYGYMPPMNKTSSNRFGTTKPTTNSIEIYNNTAYELTVWYSGADSKKIILPPRNRRSFTLPNGPYKVAASVKASNVTKYAGNERLDGGEYESEFYIQTSSGFNF